MKLRELYRSPGYYSVCECDRTERLVLHVVVGGIAMSSIVVELVPEEESEFHAEGQLDALALDVAKNHSRYEGRLLRPFGADDRLELVDVL